MGPKAAVVGYLVETALSAADEPVPAEERDWVLRFRSEPDPRLKIRLYAAPAITEIHQRLAPLWAMVLEADGRMCVGLRYLAWMASRPWRLFPLAATATYAPAG